MPYENFSQTQKRISSLGDKAEDVILRFFEAYGSDAPAADSLPKMTDFNVIISAIKRLQEARLDLLKEAPRHESHAGTGNPDPASASIEASEFAGANTIVPPFVPVVSDIDIPAFGTDMVTPVAPAVVEVSTEVVLDPAETPGIPSFVSERSPVLAITVPTTLIPVPAVYVVPASAAGAQAVPFHFSTSLVAGAVLATDLF